MEIFTFLYYANEESDDLTGGSTKTVQHSITNISRTIKHGSYKKLKPFFKDFSRTFQGPNLLFKDPSWNAM